MAMLFAFQLNVQIIYYLVGRIVGCFLRIPHLLFEKGLAHRNYSYTLNHDIFTVIYDPAVCYRIAYPQKINREVDKYTKEVRIETRYTTTKPGLF